MTKSKIAVWLIPIIMIIFLVCYMIGMTSFQNGERNGAKEALIDHKWAVQTVTTITYKGDILTKKEIVKVNPYN
jgi:hypothetical protein